MRRLSRIISDQLDKLAIKRKDSRTVVTLKLIPLVPLCTIFGLVFCLAEAFKEYWDEIKTVPKDIREMYQERS